MLLKGSRIEAIPVSRVIRKRNLPGTLLINNLPLYKKASRCGRGNITIYITCVEWRPALLRVPSKASNVQEMGREWRKDSLAPPIDLSHQVRAVCEGPSAADHFACICNLTSHCCAGVHTAWTPSLFITYTLPI